MGVKKKRLDKIKNDPKATRSDIIWWAQEDPIGALRHPNCPVDLWWQLAALHPLEAEESVLFDLFALEAPDRWDALEKNNAENWLQQFGGPLSQANLERLTADIVERALPFIEDDFPNERRPRAAMEAQRAFADGRISRDQLSEALDDANFVAEAIPHPLWAFMTARAAGTGSPVWAAFYVADAFGAATGYAPRHPERDLARQSSFQWAWHRMKGYLKGYLPGPAKDAVGAFFPQITIPLSYDENRWQADRARVTKGFAQYLSRPSQYLYAADVAERLWPRSGNDPRAWAAIEAVRAYGLGQISKAELDKAAKAINQVWNDIQGDRNRNAEATIAYEAARAAAYGHNIAENYFMGDWSLVLLEGYLQLEANNALLRADERGLPPMEGQPDLIPVALIIREQAASQLDNLRTGNFKKSKTEIAHINEMQSALAEATDAAAWVAALKWPDSAFGSLVYNRRAPVDWLQKDLRAHRPVQDQLSLAEEVAQEAIQGQWQQVEQALIEQSLVTTKRSRPMPMPAQRRLLTGLATWMDELQRRRQMLKQPEIAFPAFYVTEEPPRPRELHPVLSLWYESPPNSGTGYRIAWIDQERLLFLNQRSGRVGGVVRSPEEIMADPKATEEEVRSLRDIDAIKHPNCPRELWWRVAQDLPMTAQQSVLYPILTLESPDRWFQLERDYASDWVEGSWTRLLPKDRRLFAADCAEHVLPHFEDAYPEDDRPRKAIAAARVFANSNLTKKSLALLQAAYEDADAAYNEARDASSELYEEGAPGEERERAESAERAAGAAMYATANSSSIFDTSDMAAEVAEDPSEESVWQWHRLLFYLGYSKTKVGAVVGADPDKMTPALAAYRAEERGLPPLMGTSKEIEEALVRRENAVRVLEKIKLRSDWGGATRPISALRAELAAYRINEAESKFQEITRAASWWHSYPPEEGQDLGFSPWQVLYYAPAVEYVTSEGSTTSFVFSEAERLGTRHPRTTARQALEKSLAKYRAQQVGAIRWPNPAKGMQVRPNPKAEAAQLLWVDPSLLRSPTAQQEALETTQALGWPEGKMAAEAAHSLFGWQQQSATELYAEFLSALADQLWLLLDAQFASPPPDAIMPVEDALEVLRFALPARPTPDKLTHAFGLLGQVERWNDGILRARPQNNQAQRVQQILACLSAMTNVDPRTAIEDAMACIFAHDRTRAALRPWIKNYLHQVALRP